MTGTIGNADKNSRYRTKFCKYCGKPHKKRGIYCNQACSNRDRPEYSQKVSETSRRIMTEYQKTPEAIAKVKLKNNPRTANLTTDDFAINIPTFYDIPEGYDPADDW